MKILGVAGQTLNLDLDLDVAGQTLDLDLDLDVAGQTLPVQHGSLPLGLDRRLQRVAILFGVVVVGVVDVGIFWREIWPIASSVNCEDCLAALFQNLFDLTVAVIVELKPILGGVVLHEVPVGVEEDAPVVVDAGHPDRQDGCLHPGAEAELVRQIFVGLPDEQSDLVPARDPNLPVSILWRFKKTSKNPFANSHRSWGRLPPRGP